MLRARIRRSPDTSDALALSFLFTVEAKPQQQVAEEDEFPGMYQGSYGGSWMR